MVQAARGPRSMAEKRRKAHLSGTFRYALEQQISCFTPMIAVCSNSSTIESMFGYFWLQASGPPPKAGGALRTARPRRPL